MDIDKVKNKWHGSLEKKWSWYKHTKPCNNMMSYGSCSNSNCNYAHTVVEYLNAITKRGFTVDSNIVNSLQLVDLSKNTKKRSFDEDDDEPSAKRQRAY